MGIKMVDKSEEEKYVDVAKLKPGDTFVDDEGEFFLVTNALNKDEGERWLEVNLTTGRTSAMEDDDRIRLVDLVLSREK